MHVTSTRQSLAARQALMKICTRASVEEMRRALEEMEAVPEAIDLRKPEIGMVMLRGRIGGDGAPFNLGEATATRAVVKLGTGEVGYAYILGREPERARLAAVVDALGQRDDQRARLEAALVAPVTARLAQENELARRRTAATRVNFFTLVRGEG